MKAEKFGTDKYINVEKVIPLALICLLAFFKTAAVTLFDAKAPASFLATFGGADIPCVLLSQSVLAGALGALLLFLKEKNNKMPAYALAFAGFVPLILHFFSLRFAGGAVPFLMMTWQEGFRLIVEVCFWITLVRFGMFAQKTTMIVFVTSFQIAGAACAAWFIRLLLILNGTYIIVPASALLIFCAAACVSALAENGSIPFSEEHLFANRQTGHTGAERRNIRLKRLLFLTAFLIACGGGIFNYTFWTASARRFDSQYEPLLLLFANIAFLSSLTWALLIVFALLRKNSLLKLSFLFIIPLSFVMAGASGFCGGFACVMAAKILYDTAFFRFKEPVLQIFPHIISRRIAFKISIVRRFAVEPAALAAAAVVLLVLEKTKQTAALPVGLEALALLCAALLLYLKKSYIQNACLTLKRRLWHGGTVMISGHRLKKQLQKDLNSPVADDAIYALRVLENAQYFSLMKKLVQALSHERKKVREFALERLEYLNFVPALPAVKLCALQDPSRRVRCRAVRVMCHLGSSLEAGDALTMLHNPDLREGALIGLLSEKAEGMFAAIALMNDLSQSALPEDRMLVARVIGEVRNPDFYRPLLPLLNDISADVRKEALTAAGKLLHPALISNVLAAFYTPYLRETAISALMEFSETAFPEIEREIKNLRNPIQYRNLLIKTVNQIDSPVANDFLFDTLCVGDRRVRFTILRFLCLKSYRAAGKNQNKIRLYLYDEIEWSTSLLAGLEVLEEQKRADKTDVSDILINAVNVEIEYAKERIILLLGLLHPSKKVLKLTNALHLSKEQEQADRLSLIQELLTGELKTLCLPLFEDLTVSQRLAVLRPQFLPPVMSFFDRLMSFLHMPSGDGSEWLKTCTVYVLGKLKDRRAVDALLPLLRAPEPVIRETAIWALGNILTNDEVVAMLSGCVYDPFAPAAHIARFMLDKTRKFEI